VITTSAYSQGSLDAKPIADADAYSTSATFSIDGEKKPMTSVVATIEDRPMYGPRYKWLILNFYSFPLTQENIASAKTGDIKPIEKRIYEADAKGYNNSNAKIILSIDSTNNQITQVDMAVPGYTCTVVEKSKDLQRFSENYSFENSHIKLKNNSSYECDMNAKKILFGWDFSVNTIVAQKQVHK